MSELAGARFLFERVAIEDGAARYAVTIGESGDAAKSEARIAKGVLDLGPFDRPVEGWAVEVTRAFLRTLTKNHAEAGDWPRRLHRWRAPKA